jgi:uncharacterized membrane protein
MPEENQNAASPKPSIFKASEWRQILTTLILTTVTLFVIAVLFGRDPQLATTLLSSIGLHLAGARAPAVLYCLGHGLSPTVTLLFNFYIEVVIVVLVYYAFILFVREGIESKLLHLAAKQAEESAQTHRDFLKRFERFGLFLLVIAPLPMTGPVTGALVGYLLNLKPWMTFLIVLSGTFVANSVYVVLGHAVLTQIITMQAEYEGIATIIIGIVIAGFTIFHVRSIANWVKDSVSDPKRKD